MSSDLHTLSGAYALNALSAEEAEQFQRHLEACPACTQEVFLDVWRKATRFDVERGKAKTWVMTIAHRRAVDAVRRSEAQKRQDHQGAPEEVSHDEPADALIAAEEHGAVRDCLETLTELQLESVRLAYFNGYTYGEVATLLDKPLPTIKTRMRDGLIRLRDCLEGAR